MMKRTFALLLLVFGTATAAGQTAPEPTPIHVTDWLDRQPEARAALVRYHEMKAAGLLPAGKTEAGYALGDTRDFKVYNFETTSYDTIEFTLMAEGAAEGTLVKIWVETAELSNGHVRLQDVSELQQALEVQTPAGAQGIVARNEQLFGTAPLSGEVHVLLVDIRDGRVSGGGYVAGFVTSADLTSTGNQARVLYLDTQPGLYADDGSHRGTLSAQKTAAHEYQHLIHYNYDLYEETFVNEGLSEYAEVVNGYTARSIRYLEDRARYNVALYRWSSQLLAEDVFDDYQRAGLFTNYLGDRIGPAAASSVTRETARGDAGYEAVLSGQGLTFRDVLLDFHTANLLNDDVDLSGRFAYSTPQRQTISAQRTIIADGRTATASPAVEDTLAAGAALYLTWTNVEDFELLLDVNPSDAGQVNTLRSRTLLRAVLEPGDGTVLLRDFSPTTSAETFAGPYERITVIAAHVLAGQSTSTPIRYSARWNVEAQYEAVAVQYDDSLALAYGIVDGSTAGFATQFAVPPNTRLGTISLPIYYHNQFSISSAPPDDAPRDFYLTIWAQSASGRPGAVLFSSYVTDPRANADVPASETHNRYLDLDLFEETAGLVLPDTILIGATNAGSDDNYIVFSASAYEARNLSFVQRSSGWTAVWNLDGFAQHLIPVRTTFYRAAPESNLPPDPLPPQFSLATNFPNPFRGQTRIAYSLSEAAQVQLTVHDLLGRRVATLVDELQQAGPQDVLLDASGWPSGVYFYSLRAGSLQVTRRMVLLK